MCGAPEIDPCIFCEIVAHRAPASVVVEDEIVVAFLDVRPVTEGHILIVPRGHAAGLADLPPEVGAHLFTTAMQLAGALRRSDLRCDGVNLFLADGEAAFQEVFHVHLHLFPRFVGDSFRIDADWSSKPSRSVMDEVAGRLRAVFSEPGFVVRTAE
jgi:histidine triad (HIT) family protein